MADPSQLDVLRARISEVEQTHSIAEIARLVGRPRSWVRSVRDGEIKNPGILHVETALIALNKLEGAEK